jgi:hypothetical protein
MALPSGARASGGPVGEVDTVGSDERWTATRRTDSGLGVGGSMRSRRPG